VAERAAIAERLARLDAQGAEGPWTLRVLEVIARWPGVRAGVLAEEAGIEKERFKRDVRKLKELGLTESVMPGYRLSPRGCSVLEALRDRRS
jgi:DNA-binding IclR family transcriptional regulator